MSGKRAGASGERAVVMGASLSSAHSARAAPLPPLGGGYWAAGRRLLHRRAVEIEALDRGTAAQIRDQGGDDLARQVLAQLRLGLGEGRLGRCADRGP